MEIEAWPPPISFESVLAFVGDVWVQVYRPSDRGWDAWHPHSLLSHGCGCCSYSNPAPLYWGDVPSVPQA